jgi:FkbM family methyltransferase
VALNKIIGKVKGIIKQIISIGKERRNKINPFQKISFSQSGEDIIIEYLFGLRNMIKPVCLDIGAYHPLFSNNTYKFYLKGATIVNIDANPTAIEKFKQVRPNDINLNVGVGAHDGDFDFYIMEDESLNTFSKEEMIHLEATGNLLKEVKKITMLPVNKIMEDYFKGVSPDLISIDAEGVDFDIIRSFDFNKYTPKVICIESINYTPDGTGIKRYDLCSYIENKGYFEYANTNINSVFVNKEWWFSPK